MNNVRPRLTMMSEEQIQALNKNGGDSFIAYNIINLKSFVSWKRNGLRFFLARPYRRLIRLRHLATSLPSLEQSSNSKSEIGIGRNDQQKLALQISHPRQDRREACSNAVKCACMESKNSDIRFPRCSRVRAMQEGRQGQLVSSSSPLHIKEKSEFQESKRRYSNKVSTC